MNGVAGGLEPCPHCGEQHPPEALVCPVHKLMLPLQGRLLASKFRFDKLLGEGGMGWVWAAENIFVKKTVAIKLIRSEFATNPAILGRFRNEATAAGQIGSPHICDILDFGQSELGPYIVMELMRGRALNDLIEASGRLDPGLAVLIVRQTLEGLDAAHRAGIIHRDLKPENIFLSEPTPGRLLVKLVDFGISKFSQAETGTGKTGIGVLMGTPEYMSPEQSEGAANVDERTDIWAMGLILFKALTGVDAFGGPTIAATLVAVATREPPSLSELAPHVPPELAAVIGRCIQKPPELRFGSARELSQALAPFENLPPAPPVPTGPPMPAGPMAGAPAAVAASLPGGSPPMSMAPGSAPNPTYSASAPHPAAGSPSLAGPGPATVADGGTAPPGFTSARAEPELGPVRGSGATWSTELSKDALGATGAADSWSMGQAEVDDDARGDGRKKSSGGKGGSIVVLLLVLVAVGAGVYFTFGPGAGGGGSTSEGPAMVAGSGGESGDSAAAASTTTGTTGTTAATGTTGATTGTGGTGATGGTDGTTGGTTGETDGDDNASKGGKGSTKKRVNADKSLVVSSGAYYTPKEESSNSTLDGAKKYCAKLKSKRFARLRNWKLASSKEVLKFAGKKEISKFLYWTRDKPEKDEHGVAVVMMTKRSTERPESDKRARPFCVARS